MRTGRPAVGAPIIVATRKWPDRPSRQATAVVLGDDLHGTWLGHVPDSGGDDHAYVFLIPSDGWWIGRHFSDGGWKLDVTTPPIWSRDMVEVIDLDVDVRRLHGETWVEDEDEFAERRSAYPEDVARHVPETAQQLYRWLDDFDDAFGPVADEWLARVHSRSKQPRHRAALFFDMGGVLTVEGGDAHRRAWCARLDVTPSILHGAYVDAIGPGWEGGRRPKEIVARLANRLNITIDDADQLVTDLHCDHVMDAELVAIAESLPAEVCAGIISNNGADVRRRWRRAHDIDARFRPIIISGEERIAKPDPRIYRVAAARAGVPPEACLFVDDDLANVEAAAAVGMHAIAHRASSDTAGEITRWLETVATRG